MGISKRKAPSLNIPKQDEDPAERKRVLNVLAQRRYRQRRKQHVKKLESGTTSDNSLEQSATDVGSSAAEDALLLQAQEPNIASDDFRTFDEAYPPGVFEQAAASTTLAINTHTDPFDTGLLAFPEDLQLPTYDNIWDLPSLPSSPTSQHNSSLTSYSTPSASSKSPPYTFPDDYHLYTIEMDILRAATSIASRLNILPLIWDLTATSPIADPINLHTDYSHLPLNLQPSALQRQTPHHPILDLIPWPQVRDRLLMVFSLPENLRPSIAAKPTALVDFVYDLEDSAEGARIWGDDPYCEQNWEVGEKLFKGWWWAFDSETVERSNIWRKGRGARLLGRGEGAVLGEVA